MRIPNNYQLRRYLAREILGRELPRKPPASERRGPPRDAKYRAWIRTLPCAACGTTRNIEAAHTGSDGGMSEKASDYSCIPLCVECHQTGQYAYHKSKRDFERHWRVNCARLVKRLNRIWWKLQRSAA